MALRVRGVQRLNIAYNKTIWVRLEKNNGGTQSLYKIHIVQIELKSIILDKRRYHELKRRTETQYSI